MTSELRYLITVHSDHEVCDEQESLANLLSDLHTAANDMDLDLDGAYFQAKAHFESRDLLSFCPCI
jgi:hypothetical protein